MIVKNTASKIYSVIRAGIVACLLPVFFIYIFVGKPDYKILDSISGIVVPVAHFIGDGITFPIRIIGRLADDIRSRSLVRQENKELRRKLDELMAEQSACRTLIDENDRLKGQLAIVQDIPFQTVVAGIIHDNSAIAHSTFIIGAGKNRGIAPGMAVISFDGNMVGIVASVSVTQSKIRALSDSKSNIPVRVTGTDVHGFMRGGGLSAPSFGFYSDPEFSPNNGNILVTSGIKGALPNGIPVGTISKVDKVSSSIAPFASVGKLHDVVVLLFDNGDNYK